MGDGRGNAARLGGRFRPRPSLVKTLRSTRCGRESRQIRVIEQRDLTIRIPDSITPTMTQNKRLTLGQSIPAITPHWQEVVRQVTEPSQTARM